MLIDAIFTLTIVAAVTVTFLLDAMGLLESPPSELTGPTVKPAMKPLRATSTYNKLGRKRDYRKGGHYGDQGTDLDLSYFEN